MQVPPIGGQQASAGYTAAVRGVERLRWPAAATSPACAPTSATVARRTAAPPRGARRPALGAVVASVPLERPGAVQPSGSSTAFRLAGPAHAAPPLAVQPQGWGVPAGATRALGAVASPGRDLELKLASLGRIVCFRTTRRPSSDSPQFPLLLSTRLSPTLLLSRPTRSSSGSFHRDSFVPSAPFISVLARARGALVNSAEARPSS